MSDEEPIKGSGTSVEGKYICDDRPPCSMDGPGLSFKFQARNLIKMDWLSKSDPLVAVFARNSPKEKWEFFDKTEYLNNADNCDWEKSIFVPIGRDGIREGTHIMFCLYDVDEASILNDKDRLGWAEMKVGKLIEEGKKTHGFIPVSLFHDSHKHMRKMKHEKTTFGIAITFVEPRSAQEHQDTMFGENMFRRRIVRQTVVPFVEKVKVPVITRHVVPCIFRKRLKTKRFIEVQVTEDVEHTYVEQKEVEAVRMKKIWVQKEVEEEYTERVPVEKTRIVKKPVIKYETVDEVTTVMLPGTKVVEEVNYRIDTVHKKKLVEVEEWEYYELKHHYTQQRLKGASTIKATIEQYGHLVKYKDAQELEDQNTPIGLYSADGERLPAMMMSKEEDGAYNAAPFTPAESSHAPASSSNYEALPAAEPAHKPVSDSRAARRERRKRRKNRQAADQEEF